MQSQTIASDAITKSSVHDEIHRRRDDRLGPRSHTSWIDKKSTDGEEVNFPTCPPSPGARCLSSNRILLTDGGYDTSSIDRWRKAQKKPVEVEFRGPYRSTDIIETIEGDFEIDEEYIEEHGGYVIIRGVEGEVYPCGLDIFRETYEQVRNERSLDTATERRGSE
jgi:hypothetical protein